MKSSKRKRQSKTGVLGGVSGSDEIRSRSFNSDLALSSIYFISGIPALVYQTVWQRLLVLHSGVGSVSIAIIVAAYLLGIGMGSYLGGRLSRRLEPKDCLLFFGALELSIAICGYVSPTILYDVLYQRFGWMYVELWIACILHTLTLIVPTTLMGATLPFMTRALVSDGHSAAKKIGFLYGLNTMGAAAGAAFAPWILMPFVGAAGACSIAAAVNFGVGSTAILIRQKFVFHGGSSPAISTATGNQTNDSHEQNATSFWFWMLLYFSSGLSAIALEIIWFRILDVAVKSTSFTFGTLLATYLSCLALGAIYGSRNIERVQHPLATFLFVQCGIIITSGIAILLLIYVPSFPGLNWLVEYWGSPEPKFPTWNNFFPCLVLYFVLPHLLIGYPTFLMGYSFCVLQRGVQRDARVAGYQVGILQAANIAGCILGSMSVGLWALKALGTSNTMRAIVLSGSLFAAVGICRTHQRQRFIVATAVLILVGWFFPNNQMFWKRFHGQPHDSETIVAEDLTGVAAVSRDSNGTSWTMSANGKAQSHLPYGGFHSKLGALPATLHANPKSIAIIGLGSGNTAWSAACREETTEIVVFEVCTAESLLMPYFSKIGNWPNVNQFVNDSRVRIDGRDARYVLKANAKTYDIIEADAIRPNGAYAGYLYSIEFFKLCGSRLNTGGFMCTWAPTPGTIATFRLAFPHVVQLDGGYLLIGSNDPIVLDTNSWSEKFSSSHLSRYLGPDVVRECLASIEQSTVLPEPFDNLAPNSDLFPYDEFR